MVIMMCFFELGCSFFVEADLGKFEAVEFCCSRLLSFFKELIED